MNKRSFDELRQEGDSFNISGFRSTFRQVSRTFAPPLAMTLSYRCKRRIAVGVSAQRGNHNVLCFEIVSVSQIRDA